MTLMASKITTALGPVGSRVLKTLKIYLEIKPQLAEELHNVVEITLAAEI